MYVGNQSRHQNYYRDINLPTVADLPGIMAGTTQRNTVNPYLGFGSISMSTNGANAHYNGLQVDLNSQIKRDLSLRVFYTLSRSIDPSISTGLGGGGGDLTTVANPYQGWQYDVGRSGYDRLHNLSFNFIYDVPFMRHASNALARTLVGGWEVSGIVTMMSGMPLNVTMSSGLPVPNTGQCGDPATIPSCGNYDQAGNGVGASNRPMRVGAIGAPHTKQQWLDGSGFAYPTTIGAFGNLPYDSIDGPGRDNWNLSVFKNFVISETRGSHFELRLETFNTFNHPQINGFNTLAWSPGNVSNGSFGQPNGFFDGRIVQLGGKITF
jgi:hypothetical protein